MWIYFIVINVLGSILFLFDKYAAKKNRYRIPELALHGLELFGSVFSIIVLMYVIRHKNRKFGYYFFTWLILAGWIVLLYDTKFFNLN